jgi:hypothetical protein
MTAESEPHNIMNFKLLTLTLILTATQVINAQIQGDQQNRSSALISTLEHNQVKQNKVADCTDARTPIQWNGITLSYSSEGLHLSGIGIDGTRWTAAVPASGIFTCEVWTTRLYKGSKGDLIIMSRNHDPEGFDTELTIFTFDQRQLPIPWQSIGKFTSTKDGITQIVKENEGGDSALIIPIRQGDKYDGFAYVQHLIEVKATGFKKITGSRFSLNWPIISGNQKALSGAEGKDILSENIETSDAGGQTSLQSVASPSPKNGIGGITLSDGTKSMFPAMLVVDSLARTRTIYFAGDVPDALNDMQKKTYDVQLTGQTCEEEECRPLLMFATEH